MAENEVKTTAAQEAPAEARTGIKPEVPQAKPAPAALDPDEMYAELEQKIKESGHQMDLGRIRAAYETACMAHSGQKRRDGSPYVTHCVAAAGVSSHYNKACERFVPRPSALTRRCVFLLHWILIINH